jgi:hypothetical protein
VRTTLVLCLLVMLATQTIAEPSPSTAPAAIAPEREIGMGGKTWVSLGHSEDGRDLYVFMMSRRVNAWALMVYYWPEALAGILGIAGFRWLARSLRRARALGEFHCFKCDYLLKGIAGPRCPECGLELKPGNRVRGEGKKRVLLPLILLLAVAGWYATGRNAFTRTGCVGDWMVWRWEGLAYWGEDRGWVERHTQWQEEVMLVDLEGKRPMRRVCWVESLAEVERPSSETLNGCLSADRRFLFRVAGIDGWEQVDLRTGRVVQRARGLWLYSVRAPETGPANILYGTDGASVGAWDIQSGRKLGELSFQADPDTFVPHVFSDGRAVIGSNQRPFVIWQATIGISSELPVRGPWIYRSGMVYSIVGGGVHDTKPWHLEIWDINKRSKVDDVELGVADRGWILDQSEDLVLLRGTSFDDVILFNKRTHKREGLIAGAGQDGARFSPDGKWIVRYAGTPRGNEIWVYRVDQVRKAR